MAKRRAKAVPARQPKKTVTQKKKGKPAPPPRSREKPKPKKIAKRSPRALPSAVKKKDQGKRVHSAKREAKKRFEKRSRAALKGWNTRRINAGKKFGEFEENVALKLKVASLEEKVRIFEEEKKLGEIAFALGMIKGDGSLAKQPSRIRKDDDGGASVRDRLLELYEEYGINSEDFIDEVHDLSDDYEIPIREVYALFFSG